MQANSFWKNYSVAQEWRTRHSLTWWRSYCAALEYENEELRKAIRILIKQLRRRATMVTSRNENVEENVQYKDEELDTMERVLNSSEISEGHRKKLKPKYKSKKAAHKVESTENNLMNDHARKEKSTELYGEAGSKILAMEAAIHISFDIDKVESQFWPNNPLKP